MFGSPSPLVSPYSYQKAPETNRWYSQTPQEVEFMTRQKFQQPMNQPQQYQTDPYSELQAELANCSVNVRNKIISDNDYKICDANCELLIKQAIEEVFIPQILNTPKGRIEMERFVGVVKNLKEKYTQEEIATNEQLQNLLNDEIVRNRMQQLSQDKIPQQVMDNKGNGK